MIRPALLAFLLTVFTACSATKQADTVETSGFLGDYSQLVEGGDDEVLLVYRKPDLSLRGYRQLIVDPVELWAAETDDPEQVEVLEALAVFLRSTVVESLKDEFTIVETPGDGTLRLRMAITEAEGAPPVANLATTIVPWGLAFSLLKSAVTGRGLAVGAASFEAELTDSMTDERLMAGVDRRFGNKQLGGSISRWDDAEEAYKFWAAKMLDRARDLKAR